ncbi:MAG: DUF2723 domain-containing protein [Deltaproteobacteria bacterium]|jgi:hypothetical protein|nr:DUF2723 domain-containing protein [Deltaproteobacteria bacterium]
MRDHAPPPSSRLEAIFDSNFALLFLALLATFFYIAVATAGYGWRDGPEFAVTATYLDVAHPSGFPTYNLLAKILTWLPLGAIGFRVTVFTAMMGGLSLFLLAALARSLHKLDPARPAYGSLLAPVLFYGLCQAVFVAATELEVYSLNSAFLLLLILLATKWREGRGEGFLYLGGFVYGLSCGNHAAMSLYLPFLALLAWWGEPSSFPRAGARSRNLKRLGILALLFLAGLSVYLLLYVRSQTDSLPVDFGRTNSLARFWNHISDAKDSEYHFKGVTQTEDLLFFLQVQFRNLTSPLFWLSLPFVGWGLRFLWRRFQILSVALVALILINMGFFYYWIDGSSAFIPSVTAYFILFCVGLGQAGRWLRERPALPREIATALGAAVLALSFLSLGRDRLQNAETVSGFQSTELFFPDLAALPPDSLVIHHAAWFPLLALQYVYGTRPDVSLIFASGLLAPRLMAPPEPIKLPLAYFPTDGDGDLLSPLTPGFPNFFLNANMDRGRHVFTQYGTEIAFLTPYLRPGEEFLWLAEIKRDPNAGISAILDGTYERYLRRLTRYFSAFPAEEGVPIPPKAPAQMYYVLREILEFTFKHREYLLTAETADKFLAAFSLGGLNYLLPTDVLLNAKGLVANSYRLARDFPKAEAATRDLIALRPHLVINWILLGLIYDNQRLIPQTLEAWRKAVDLDPYSNTAVNRYFLALAKYRSLKEATDFIGPLIAQMDKDGLYFTRDLYAYYRDCLALPPTRELPPEGNFLYRSIYEGKE